MCLALGAGDRRRVDARRRPAQRRRRPAPEPERPHVGGRRLRPHPRLAPAGGGRPRRPVRPTGGAAGRDRRVRGRLAALRPGHLRRRARGLPGPHRHRRGPDHARHAVDHHERLPTRGAGPRRRRLGRLRRRRRDPRDARRRWAARHLRLAVHLLPDRRRRGHHLLRGAGVRADQPLQRARRPRPPGHGALGPGHRVGRPRDHGRTHPRLERTAHRRVPGRRRDPGHRVHPVGAARRAPAARPAAVPLPRLRHRFGLVARAVHRPVRHLPGDPPVPAAAPRLQRARGPPSPCCR